jgi:dTDP-4-amino-4,6-dideoxygalactose transaminase
MSNIHSTDLSMHLNDKRVLLSHAGIQLSARQIQLFAPVFDVDACLAEIRECLELGWTGIGFKTVEFEDRFSEYLGAPFCHFVNSNTNGIHLLLEVLKSTRKWADGDEVISSGMTFVSANHSILHAGLAPVFADVDSSLCMTLAEIEKKVTSKTRAVMFVGIGGNAGELAEISRFCRSSGFLLILDAAHCAGSRLNARHLSHYADYSIFSFQAVKNLPTGDAGLITVRTEEENHLVRKLSWCGIDKDTFSRSRDGYQWMYSVTDVGYKYHGNSIMAAIAIVQLRSLETGNSRRRELASLYSRQLDRCGSVCCISHSNETESSRHLVQFIAPRRNKLIEYLKTRGVGTGVHYLSNSRYPMYAHNHIPLAEELDDKIISLPCHLRMSDEDVDYVVECVTTFYRDM